MEIKTGDKIRLGSEVGVYTWPLLVIKQDEYGYCMTEDGNNVSGHDDNIDALMYGHKNWKVIEVKRGSEWVSFKPTLPKIKKRVIRD